MVYCLVSTASTSARCAYESRCQLLCCLWLACWVTGLPSFFRTLRFWIMARKDWPWSLSTRIKATVNKESRGGAFTMFAQEALGVLGQNQFLRAARRGRGPLEPRNVDALANYTATPMFVWGQKHLGGPRHSSVACASCAKHTKTTTRHAAPPRGAQPRPQFLSPKTFPLSRHARSFAPGPPLPRRPPPQVVR